MSHHIYTTEGIVIKRMPDDNSASYFILTNDLGLIRAKAQGVRKIDSKLKFALQEYCVSTISFVRGKSGWRITSASPIKNLYSETKEVGKQKTIGRILAVILRLVYGEEKNENLYKCIMSGLNSISNASLDKILTIELLLMARIMYILGYISKDTLSTDIFSDPLVVEENTLNYVFNNSTEITTLVNKGLKESQL